jgi:hypothetical protein
MYTVYTIVFMQVTRLWRGTVQQSAAAVNADGYLDDCLEAGLFTLQPAALFSELAAMEAQRCSSSSSSSSRAVDSR